MSKKKKDNYSKQPPEYYDDLFYVLSRLKWLDYSLFDTVQIYSIHDFKVPKGLSGESIMNTIKATTETLTEITEKTTESLRKYTCSLFEEVWTLCTSLHYAQEFAANACTGVFEMPDNEDFEKKTILYIVETYGTDEACRTFYEAYLWRISVLNTTLLLLIGKIENRIAGKVVLTRLKKEEAETVVKKILHDNPHTSWTLRKMEEHLEGLHCQYGYNSIRTLDAWKQYEKDNPYRKPDFIELTGRRLKSIDSTGKPHFSRDKKASNYSNEDD